jgi:hypothetical protein
LKVFASLFSKSDRGLGAAPQVAPAGAKPFHAVFASFCGFLLKKKGNGLRSVTHNQNTPSKALGTAEGSFSPLSRDKLCTLHKMNLQQIYTLSKLTLDKRGE